MEWRLYQSQINCRVDAEKLRELDRDYDAVFRFWNKDYLKKVRAKNENPNMGGYWGGYLNA